MRQFNSVLDFISDETFCSFVLDTDSECVDFWNAYILSNPDQKELIDEAKEEVLLIHHAIADYDRNVGLDKLKSALELNDKQKVQTKSFSLRVWMSVAAVFVAILFGVFYYTKGIDRDQYAYQGTFITKTSERDTLSLPDGSKVIMNASSKIVIDDHFGHKDRIVLLDGEAYFDVAHDKTKPFKVILNGVEIKVLGTTFNVKSYADEKFITTSLLSGSIEVDFKNKKYRNIVLKPSEKLVVSNPNYEEKEMVILVDTVKNLMAYQRDQLKDLSAKKLTVETSWTTEKLVFDDQPLEDIVKTLARWYGVSIKITDKELENRRYTATFNDDESIENIFWVFSNSVPFKYRRVSDNKIIIDP